MLHFSGRIPRTVLDLALTKRHRWDKPECLEGYCHSNADLQGLVFAKDSFMSATAKLTFDKIPLDYKYLATLATSKTLSTL